MNQPKMQPESWRAIKEILSEVSDLSASERAGFFDKANLNPLIRREVESLLAFENAPADALDYSAIEFSKDFFDKDFGDGEAADNALVGQQIGAYEIVRELGWGGMGAVYLATRADGKFAQRVALKLLKRELNTNQIRRHFEQEREILASLEHPNIARLLDAGVTDDKIPFLVMEFVDGVPIDEFCLENNLNLTERLELFCKICQAVSFAHRNLIVHRDLKPSNILVAADGAPKLLDFGISKIVSATGENSRAATITKLGVMTPGYAAPEQLRGETVTTAADIYSLGVILYELLTAHRPFEVAEPDFKKIYQAVVETEPAPPSQAISDFGLWISDSKKTDWRKSTTKDSEQSQDRVNPKSKAQNLKSLRGDLDNIVLKALRKEPERRYSSAENFADDIRRHLQGLPVTARPNTFSYLAEKFVKRNRAAVFAAALVLLAVAGGAAATLWQARAAQAQARIAQVEKAKAERRFNDVRTLANSFLFEFSPKIQNLPGSTPARQLLVTRALEYLDNLSVDAGEDKELQRELAKAYEKVGDVQGNPYNPNIGDTKGALENYEKARAIQQNLLTQDSADKRAQNDLADILKLIGDIHSNGGDYALAADSYDQALELLEKLAVNNSSNFDSRAKLAKFTRTRGIIPFWDGDNKKAVEFYTRAKNIYEPLRREQPDNPQITDEYAYTLTLIGEAQGWDNDFAGGAANLQKGLDLLIPLGEKYPNDLSIQRSVMLAHNKRAENHQDLKEFEKSVELLTKGVQIADDLLKADSQNVQAKRDVAMSNRKLAAALDDAGKSRESLDKLFTVLKMFQEMQQFDSTNSEYPYDIPNTRVAIGETYLTLKDYESALATFLTAKAEFQVVLEQSPKHIFAARVSSYNFNRLGKCYAALHQKSGRRELLDLALENLRDGINGLNKLKSDGNLGEVDNPELAKWEKEITEIENKLK